MQKLITKYKRYPAYRPSGVEWLDKIPAHWEVRRLKYAAFLNPPVSEVRHLSPKTEVSFVPMEAVAEYGGLELSLTKKLSDVAGGYTYFCNGDVLVAKITPCFENGKGTLASELLNGIAFGTTELHVLRCGPRLNKLYAFYLTVADAFRKLGEADMYGAGGQKRVPESFVANLKHPLPPLPEQQAIAAFLDQETARIDALVAKKERLIELLQEKRSALISQAVTKGLDPDAPIKDFGVEWLGEIQAHWEMRRLKYLATVNDEALPETTAPDTEITYVDIGSVDPVRGITHTEDLMFEDAPSRARRIVRQGDIIISTVRTYLKAIARIESPDTNLIVSTGFAVIRPQQLHDGFVAYALSSPYFVERVVAHSVGVGYPAINASDLTCLDIVFPPLPEQQAIAEFLDRETVKLDILVNRILEAIDRLRELRTALISAAVTGRIDVREEAV